MPIPSSASSTAWIFCWTTSSAKRTSPTKPPRNNRARAFHPKVKGNYRRFALLFISKTPKDLFPTERHPARQKAKEHGELYIPRSERSQGMQKGSPIDLTRQRRLPAELDSGQKETREDKMQTAANLRQTTTTGKRQTGRRLCENQFTGEMLRLRECRLDWLLEERRILLQSLFLRRQDRATGAALIACHSAGQRSQVS